MSARPGAPFFLLAQNRGTAPVRVAIEAGGAPALLLGGSAQRLVLPGQSQAFQFTLKPGQAVRGTVRVRSEQGARHEWWERKSWVQDDLRLARYLRVSEERWVLGSDAVLFPPGVRAQYVRIWNDSESERAFATDLPAGYRVTSFGASLERRATPVGAGNSLEVTVQATSTGADATADSEWLAGPDGVAVPLLRLPPRRAAPGPDAVVAIDFGTRNTRVRVRWRRSLVASKPAGTVDAIGDRADSSHFPSQMVLDLQERSFRWGTEAAEQIEQNRLAAEEVAVDNLKTYLREGREGFTDRNSEWTNEELLRRFMERLVNRLDEYFRGVDPAQPLSRGALNLRYVVCRPVLDSNEGDDKGSRYEAVLRRVLGECGLPEGAISFVLEPVAAAIGITRSREADLLGLPDGTPVAVIDSGGGTTDVALARVRMKQGSVSLELAGSYAAHLNDENAAVPILMRHDQPDRREFGGNVLDAVLAGVLQSDARLLLETDGRPVPPRLWDPAEGSGPRWQEHVSLARKMKERFARSSTQYLNREPGQAPEPGEVLPFPNRPELAGIYLLHGLYDERIAGPILRPSVQELAGEIHRTQDAASGVRPSAVRHVFYVGGTNIDPFVRQHFSRAFPLAQDRDPEAQSEARLRERLYAVVDGAVWSEEVLFQPSPLALTLVLKEREEPLMGEGEPLLPAAAGVPKFFTELLDPGEELQAALVASGGGLEESVRVARAFYRNPADEPREVILATQVSREKGAVAELRINGRKLEQWRLALVE